MAVVTQIDLRLQKKPRKIQIVESYSDKEKIKSKSLCSSESQVKQPGDHPAGIVLLYQDYATQKMGKENHSIADLPPSAPVLLETLPKTSKVLAFFHTQNMTHRFPTHTP